MPQKPTKPLLSLVISAVILCFPITIPGQNLVPNPSFESYSVCPVGLNGTDPLECLPWFKPTDGSTDYYHSCDNAPPPAYSGVPGNALGTQYANTGDGYCGLYTKTFNGEWREYLCVELTEPLIADHCYEVSFYISLGDFTCPSNRIGAYFSETPPIQSGVSHLNVTPQINNTIQYYTDFLYWTPIQGVFTASGGERYLTIGNFFSDPETNWHSSCQPNQASYYFVDDVSVIETVPVGLGLELGDPITTCYSYVIDPGLSGVDYLWSDGSTGPELSVTASGTYSVTVSTDCESEEDEIEIIITNSPPVVLSPDEIVLCDGDMLTLDLDPDAGTYEWSDGTTDPSFTITGPGTYAVELDDGCDITSDDITVLYVSPPQPFSLGNDQSLCSPEEIEFNFYIGLGDFLWSDGSTSNSIVLTQPGEYGLTISNQCGVQTDEIILTADMPPLIDLGPDLQGLCTGDTIPFDFNAAPGEFQWSDGSLQPTFYITSSGVYSVTLTNECGSDSDTLSVDYMAQITEPDLGPDASLCPGETLTLAVNSSGAQILWGDSSTADTLLVTSPGIYTVQFYTSCQSLSDSIVVTTGTNAPVVDLPDSISLCQDATDTLDAMAQHVNWLWSDGSQLQQLIIMTPGTYSVTVSNACGVSSDTVIVFDGGPAPSVSLGSDLFICPGESILIGPSHTHVDFWNWSNGWTDSTFVATDSGWISVYVLNECGMASDSTYITLEDDLPDVWFGPDTALCPGQVVILSIPFSDVDILWSDGSTNPDLQVNDPGTYVATISNICSEVTDTINIIPLPAIPVLDLGPDQQLCPGESITINPGIADVTYTWHDGSTLPFLVVDQAQDIVLTISNACGISTDSVSVILSTEGPMIDLGPDILACEGDTIILSSNISGVEFLWQDGTTDPEYFTTQSGEFHLQVLNACGMDRDTVRVIIDGQAPSPFLGPDTTLCTGESLTLLSQADPQTTVNWQDGSMETSFEVTQPGLYILRESNRCGLGADSVVISYESPPIEFSIGSDTVLCPGETVLLTAPMTSDKWQWQDGSQSASYLIHSAGLYVLELSNACGSALDSIMVEYRSHVIVNPEPFEYTICPDHSLVLSVLQPFLAEYQWSTGEATPSISVTTPGQYDVTISTECEVLTTTFVVSPKLNCKFQDDFYIPNVFSPDGDQNNDVFSIFPSPGIMILSMEGNIFDRWGGLVYTSSEIPFSWDGMFRGHSVAPGVYVYRISVRYQTVNGTENQSWSGDVTVIR